MQSQIRRNEMSVTGKGVGEVVRQRLDSLSPAERRLARVLLPSHPIAGLPTGAVRGRVVGVGGRVSAPLARSLVGQLHLLRPGIGLVDTDRSAPAQQLIDMRKTDVLVIFDYRRYQPDTIECARVAAGRGCDVVLFTDPWLSPASAFARQVLVTSVETVGPFHSLVGAMAVVGGLVAAVLATLGAGREARMQNLERLRAGDVLGGNDSGG